MKTLKRTLCLLLVITTLASLLVFPASAASGELQNGSFVRIRHAGSGRYLDVPAEGISNNGTQLQIWEYAYGNQNQIFRLYKSSKGWEIVSVQSGKCVEVRNSSHNDCAQVAQWSRHSGACARWDIIYNADGTVSFRNRESGKYLNVCGGGNAPNGTKMIQYHDDKTSAMRFYIDVMGNADVLSATYTRKIRSTDLKWTRYTPVIGNTNNMTDFSISASGKHYHPTPGQKIFVSAEFLSPKTVGKLLEEHSYSQSTWNQIKSALAGEMTADGISALLKKLDFGEVPGIGYALGILQVLWNNREEEEWNRFARLATHDAQGRCSGVIVYTFYTFNRTSHYGPLNDGTTGWGWRHSITQHITLEYRRWTGDNFGSVRTQNIANTTGTWYYSFK